MAENRDDDGTSAPGPQFLDGLSRVHHHVYQATGELVGIEFRFVQGSLLAQVDPDTDEIVVSFEDDTDADCCVGLDDVTRTDVSRFDQFRQVLGSDTLWRWSLVNQQGYRDAFQIELVQRRSDNSTISTATFQYLAIAGQIEVRQVTQLLPDPRGA